MSDKKRQNLMSASQNLENMIKVVDNKLQLYNYETDMRKHELSQLTQQVNSKRNFIQNFDNEEGYIRIKEAAKKETKLLMQKNQVIFAVTLTATLEAIRRYPNNHMLISDIVTSKCYSPTSYQKPWFESHGPELLQLMQNIQDEMAEQIAKKSVNILEINHSESKLGVTA